MTGTALLCRLDSDGDVLLSGPAVRAVAARAARVVLLCGPRGEQAARLLPGVDDVLVWRCPWIDADPPPVERADVMALVERLQAVGAERALILTSFHQSPLPTALLLRLAGVPWVGATCDDYPGSLLDLRHRLPDAGLHEVERMLALAAAAGFPLPEGDDGALALRRPLPALSHLVDRLAGPLANPGPYVVLHPGASVPARAAGPARCAAIAAALAGAGRRVVVTGGPGERELTRTVASAAPGAVDLGGRTTLAELAAVIAAADVVVVGNTGPAHLAAAVGTPVVSLFAPTVPAERWRPWRARHQLLGDQHAACAGSRATVCPVPGHPCLDVDPHDVVAAVSRLAGAPASALEVSR
ncbi:MAG: glycosyltransferase family 9 protein [Frankiaceae bacterium]